MPDYQDLTKKARKAFFGHAGRPGHVGGSRPRGNSLSAVARLSAVVAALDDRDKGMLDAAVAHLQGRIKPRMTSFEAAILEPKTGKSQTFRNAAREMAFRKATPVIESTYQMNTQRIRKTLEYDPQKDVYVVARNADPAPGVAGDRDVHLVNDYAAAWREFSRYR